MATVCCLTIGNAAGETLRPLPSDANRQQFNQMFKVAPPHLGYNLYHPYGGQVMMQPSAGGFYPYYPLAAGWRYPSVDQGTLAIDFGCVLIESLNHQNDADNN